MAQTQTEETKILAYAKVNNLADMSDGQAQTVLHLLKDKRNKQIAKAEQSLSQQEQQTAV